MLDALMSTLGAGIPTIVVALLASFAYLVLTVLAAKERSVSTFVWTLPILTVAVFAGFWPALSMPEVPAFEGTPKEVHLAAWEYMYPLTYPNSTAYLTILMLGSFALCCIAAVAVFGKAETESKSSLHGVAIPAFSFGATLVTSIVVGILSFFITFLWSPGLLAAIFIFRKNSIDPHSAMHKARGAAPLIMVVMAFAGALFLRQTEVFVVLEDAVRENGMLNLAKLEASRAAGMIELIGRLVLDLGIAGFAFYLAMRGSESSFRSDWNRQAAMFGGLLVLAMAGAFYTNSTINDAYNRATIRAIDASPAEVAE